MESVKNFPNKRKASLATIVTIAVFFAILVVGLLTYQHYGYTVDESVQHEHSLVNYQYVYSKLTGTDLQIVDTNLYEYEHRTYGVALQMPMVLVEHLSGFTMSMHDVFAMRHLFTFLLCYIGYICFYLFIKKVFGNRWLALLGTLMLVIYPRFWGEQFTNIKDMVFMATCCASMLCVALCLEHEGKWRYEVLAGFVFAICANTRFIGLMMPGLLFGYRVIRDLWIDKVAKRQGRKKLWANLLRYGAQLLILLLFYIAIAPAAWEEPLAYIKSVFSTFSNYVTYNGDVLFLGYFIPANNMPWFYIPVWLGISLPIWYLALLAISIPCAAVSVLSKHRQWFSTLLTEYKYYLFCAVVAFFPILWACIVDVTLYNAWRHMYYILPFLIVLMLYGARFLWRAFGNKQVFKTLSIVAACALLAGEGVFIVCNHPFEKVYFNQIGKTVANIVDKDYWGEAYYAQFKYILAHDTSDTVKVFQSRFSELTHRFYLSAEDGGRIDLVKSIDPEAEYVIYKEDGRPLNNIEGFVLLHQIDVDGIPISTLYVRKDVFEERYNGIVPE